MNEVFAYEQLEHMSLELHSSLFVANGLPIQAEHNAKKK